MKKLKVIICKAGSGLEFHIQELYPEELQEWIDGDYVFEFAFGDLATLLEAHGDCLNQSSLARMAGINAGQMRQYAAGVKHPTTKTLQRIAAGVRTYARELQQVQFSRTSCPLHSRNFALLLRRTKL